MTAAAVTVVGGAGPAPAAPTLPQGFVLRDTATGQEAYDLTDFDYLPDGSVLTTGKTGRVTWVPRGGEPTTIAQLATDTKGDLGLVGIGVAPDYDETRHVYLVRSVPSSGPTYLMRLSRFTVQGGSTPQGLTGEQAVLQVQAPSPVHGMTTVLPAADGTLWVSVGDLQTAEKVTFGAFKAGNLDEPAGKLLHIRANGAGVSSNPHYQAAKPRSWRSRVYARGFRSPFRFSLDPQTGMPVVGDVGWRAWEEIDLLTPGKDYKWPCWEGRNQAPGYGDLPRCADVANTPPIWRYHHGSASNQGNSVTGGIVYTGSSYPAAYRGAYFFGDYAANKIWTMRWDASGRLVSPPQDPPFASDIGGPVRFQAAPNGDIVYADIVSGMLRRLSYSPGNTAPVARAATTTDPMTRTVTFDAGDSVDHDGDVLTYDWNFGDGNGGRGRRVTHTYSAAGDVFQAWLTVTDPLGASDTLGVTVAPSNHSPVVTLSRPASSRFAVGDAVQVSATGRDAEDGVLAVRWTSAIVHCAHATTCHVHPGPEATGPTWRSTFTDHPDARLQVTATVQDSAGVRASASFVARPKLRRLTLAANTPAYLQIRAGTPARTALVTQGSSVDVVAATVAADGLARFEGWDDGIRRARRTVVIGRSDLTLKATYLTPIGRRYAHQTALRRLLGRPVASEVADSRVHYRRYEHGRLYWVRGRGVHAVHGQVLRTFLRLGGHRGVVGYPVTDIRRTVTQGGRYADFSRQASIYWSPTTGGHEVHGPIRKRWRALGGERSWLGLPTTDSLEVKGGVRSEFQGGSVRWFAKSGRIVVRRR